MNLRPLDPQSSALPAAPHPDTFDIIASIIVKSKYFFEKMYTSFSFCGMIKILDKLRRYRICRWRK